MHKFKKDAEDENFMKMQISILILQQFFSSYYHIAKRLLYTSALLYGYLCDSRIE